MTDDESRRLVYMLEQVNYALGNISISLSNISTLLTQLTGEDAEGSKFIRTGDFVAALLTKD